MFSKVVLPCAVQQSFVGAIAVGDMIKTTLGPKGMVSLEFDRRQGVLVGSFTCVVCGLWAARTSALSKRRRKRKIQVQDKILQPMDPSGRGNTVITNDGK